MSEALLPPRVSGSCGSRYHIFQRNLLSLVHHGLFEWSPWAWWEQGAVIGVEVRAVGGGNTTEGDAEIQRAPTCQPCCGYCCAMSTNITQKPLFCHFRLSQRVLSRPRVKLLPRRRTRRRTDTSTFCPVGSKAGWAGLRGTRLGIPIPFSGMGEDVVEVISHPR